MRINKILHDNRNKIVVTVVAIIGVILIIQLFNKNAEIENEKRMQEFANSQYIPIPTQEDQIKHTPLANQTVSGETTEQNNNAIDTFIKYCNNKQYENAYNMLTKECKEELFPTLTDFTEKYCNKIFTEEKVYNLRYEGSTSNSHTYNIRILKNPLSAGNYEEESTIEDYYTIVETDEGDKLNISRYINRIEINKSTQKDNITLTVIYKDVYMDYERYQIKVENKTGKTILLNGEQTIGTAYGEDENQIKYTAFMYELTENEMKIDNGFSKTMKIKFNKQYIAEKTLKKLVFTNVILDYDEYKNTENKEEYNNTLTMQVSI